MKNIVFYPNDKVEVLKKLTDKYKEILKIDLNTNKEYTVKGYLGDVVLEVKDKKIRVKEETSNRHICSKEGYIYTNNKSLVCMPNKIIVKIISEDNELDGVVY